MSLYIGKDINNKNIVHITSNVVSESNMKSVQPTTVFNSTINYTTGRVFVGAYSTNSSRIPNTTPYSPEAYWKTLYWHTIDLGPEFGPFMNNSTGKKIFFIEDRVNLVTEYAYKYLYVQRTSDPSDNTDLGNTGVNSCYRFLNASNGDPQIYPNSSSRKIRFISTRTTIPALKIMVFNTLYTGVKVFPTNDYTNISINSTGILLGNTNMFNINYIFTPPINSIDTTFIAGSATFQVLNSAQVTSSLNLNSSSNGTTIKDGNKLIFSSATTFLNLFNSTLSRTIPLDTVLFTSSSYVYTLFENITSPYISITLTHPDLGLAYLDNFVIYPSSSIQNFHRHDYYLLRANPNRSIRYSIGIRYLNNKVEMVLNDLAISGYSSITIKSYKMVALLMY